MAFIQMNLMSESLMRTVNVNVILPADKLVFPGLPAPKGAPYKTLYLLHGIIGSQVDWVNGTNIQRWAEEKELCVVMPAGENMFYLDQEAPHALYGEFVGRELVELTRKIFPLSDRREDTFIGGLSMGGYGALRNGLKYSDTFGCIAALSAATVTDGIEERTDEAENFFATRRFAEHIFGDLSKVANSDKDLYYLANRLAASGKPLPKIFMACGVSDPLLPGNRKLRSALRRDGFDLHYVEAAGAHEWDFWNRQIHAVLDWLPLDGAAGISSGNVGLRK